MGRNETHTYELVVQEEIQRVRLSRMQTNQRETIGSHSAIDVRRRVVGQIGQKRLQQRLELVVGH